MSKTIPLTQNQVAIVDDDDHEWLSKHNWYALWSPHTRSFYAVRKSKRGKNSEQHLIYMARVVKHAQAIQEVDHISGQTLDNRKTNLRFCTHRQNNQNQKAKGVASHYKGVSREQRRNKWRARVYYNGKRYSLGYFNTETDAARAYNKRAVEFFGEFARLNKV